MVTPRLHRLKISGQYVHQIGVPIHFSFTGEVTGGQANELTPMVSEPNVKMHEGKSFMCDVRKGRLGQLGDKPTVKWAKRPQETPMAETPEQAQPEGRSA